MTLVELKNRLLDENGTIPDDFIIFLCEEGTPEKITINGRDRNIETRETVADNKVFIATEYIEAIAKKKGLPIVKIESLSEVANQNIALICDFSEQLSVLRVDDFEEAPPDYEEYKNCIVICNKISKKVKDLVKDYIIEMPAVMRWQIDAFIQSYCPEISATDANWLSGLIQKNVYRIRNELDKVYNFPKADRAKIFEEIKKELGNEFTVVITQDLTDALINKNMLVVFNYLDHMNVVDVEPMQLVYSLLYKYKDFLYLCNNSGCNPEKDLGMSKNRAMWIKNSAPCIPLDKLRSLIKFLTGIDYRLRNGQLDFGTNKKAFISYIINNVLELSN